MEEAEKIFKSYQDNPDEEPLPEGLPSSLQAVGWLKNGFVLSMYFLLRYDSYMKKEAMIPGSKNYFTFALRGAISVGGDTDTTACVVCGLVGALVGFNQIPSKMLGKVLSFDCTSNIISRDKFLSTKYHAMPLI